MSPARSAESLAPPVPGMAAEPMVDTDLASDLDIDIHSGSSPDLPGNHYQLTILREENAEKALAEFEQHAIAGLTTSPKSLSSQYFYDDVGSDIYARITDLEEYYPTRTEHSILTKNASMLANLFNKATKPGEALNIIELGAGDGRKTKVLLNALLKTDVNFEYIPIDISGGAMKELLASIDESFRTTNLKVHGVVADNQQAISYITSKYPERRNVVLFLGSSIGNSPQDEATLFLQNLSQNLNKKDLLLVGFDLRKDPTILQNAYSDPQGVTRDFNLNLLHRMNRELRASFDVSQFQHHAFYNPIRGTMESYLLSRTEQTVVVAGTKVHFDAGEPVHTEYSFKYRPKEVEQMADTAGLRPVSMMTDDNNWFLDMVAEVC